MIDAKGIKKKAGRNQVGHGRWSDPRCRGLHITFGQYYACPFDIYKTYLARLMVSAGIACLSLRQD